MPGWGFRPRPDYWRRAADLAGIPAAVKAAGGRTASAARLPGGGAPSLAAQTFAARMAPPTGWA